MSNNKLHQQRPPLSRASSTTSLSAVGTANTTRTNSPAPSTSSSSQLPKHSSASTTNTAVLDLLSNHTTPGKKLPSFVRRKKEQPVNDSAKAGEDRKKGKQSSSGGRGDSAERHGRARETSTELAGRKPDAESRRAREVAERRPSKDQPLQSTSKLVEGVPPARKASDSKSDTKVRKSSAKGKEREVEENAPRVKEKTEKSVSKSRSASSSSTGRNGKSTAIDWTSSEEEEEDGVASSLITSKTNSKQAAISQDGRRSQEPSIRRSPRREKAISLPPVPPPPVISAEPSTQQAEANNIPTEELPSHLSSTPSPKIDAPIPDVQREPSLPPRTIPELSIYPDDYPDSPTAPPWKLYTEASSPADGAASVRPVIVEAKDTAKQEGLRIDAALPVPALETTSEAPNADSVRVNENILAPEMLEEEAAASAASSDSDSDDDDERLGFSFDMDAQIQAALQAQKGEQIGHESTSSLSQAEDLEQAGAAEPSLATEGDASAGAISEDVRGGEDAQAGSVEAGDDSMQQAVPSIVGTTIAPQQDILPGMAEGSSSDDDSDSDEAGDDGNLFDLDAQIQQAMTGLSDLPPATDEPTDSVRQSEVPHQQISPSVDLFEDIPMEVGLSMALPERDLTASSRSAQTNSLPTFASPTLAHSALFGASISDAEADSKPKKATHPALEAFNIDFHSLLTDSPDKPSSASLPELDVELLGIETAAAVAQAMNEDGSSSSTGDEEEDGPEGLLDFDLNAMLANAMAQATNEVDEEEVDDSAPISRVDAQSFGTPDHTPDPLSMAFDTIPDSFDYLNGFSEALGLGSASGSQQAASSDTDSGSEDEEDEEDEDEAGFDLDAHLKAAMEGGESTASFTLPAHLARLVTTASDDEEEEEEGMGSGSDSSEDEEDEDDNFDLDAMLGQALAQTGGAQETLPITGTFDQASSSHFPDSAASAVRPAAISQARLSSSDQKAPAQSPASLPQTAQAAPLGPSFLTFPSLNLGKGPVNSAARPSSSSVSPAPARPQAAKSGTKKSKTAAYSSTEADISVPDSTSPYPYDGASGDDGAGEGGVTADDLQAILRSAMEQAALEVELEAAETRALEAKEEESRRKGYAVLPLKPRTRPSLEDDGHDDNAFNIVRQKNPQAGFLTYTADFKECHRVFASPEGQHTHRLTHAGPRPYACASCPLTFLSSQDLQDHEPTHNTSRAWRYRCRGCHNLFPERAALDRHCTSEKASAKCREHQVELDILPGQRQTPWSQRAVDLATVKRQYQPTTNGLSALAEVADPPFFKPTPYKESALLAATLVHQLSSVLSQQYDRQTALLGPKDARIDISLSLTQTFRRADLTSREMAALATILATVAKARNDGVRASMDEARRQQLDHLRRVQADQALAQRAKKQEALRRQAAETALRQRHQQMLLAHEKQQREKKAQKEAMQARKAQEAAQRRQAAASSASPKPPSTQTAALPSGAVYQPVLASFPASPARTPPLMPAPTPVKRPAPASAAPKPTPAPRAYTPAKATFTSTTPFDNNNIRTVSANQSSLPVPIPMAVPASTKKKTTKKAANKQTDKEEDIAVPQLSPIRPNADLFYMPGDSPPKGPPSPPRSRGLLTEAIVTIQ